MNLSLIIRFIFASITCLLLLYYILTNYSINKKFVIKTNLINFDLGMMLLLVSYFLYLFTFLLNKGQDFLADLSFSGSLISGVFGIFFYVEF